MDGLDQTILNLRPRLRMSATVGIHTVSMYSFSRREHGREIKKLSPALGVRQRSVWP